MQMKLVSVHVRNFRSVEDSGEFSVESVTCLVGKNEAGKTAILQALASIKSHSATPMSLDRIRDYPRRHLTEYSTRHPDGHALALRTGWEVSDSDVKRVEQSFGQGVLKDKKLSVSIKYEDETRYWDVNVDPKIAVSRLVSSQKFSAPERSQLGNPGDIDSLKRVLEGMSSPSEKHKKLLENVNALRSSSTEGCVRQMLAPKLPKFMYFSNYDRMSGEVRLDLLKSHLDDGSLFSDPDLRGDRLFYEFLQYAGVELDEILLADSYEEFTAKLQAASNRLTDQILEYWSQNPHIEVRVTVDSGRSGDRPPFNEGIVARARIYNSLHRVDGPFSERSAGFIWFFSFLIKFSQIDKDSSTILLLDEPGLSLHGKAQADLLRYFDERLAPSHQIIYTTHSPFMVAPNRLMSARIVEDVVTYNSNMKPEPKGTKVREDVLNTDPDVIFPLQGALGYEITQSLFVGKNTLLVEGPSDILYLQALSSELISRSRTGLDQSWVVCPTGGIGNVMPFVSLFSGNRINMCIFTDYARGDKTKLENVKRLEVLKSGAVLTAAEFTGKDEADTEDLFDPEIFLDIVNRAYSLTGKKRLTLEKLNDVQESSNRVVKKVEAYFRVLPESIPMYDHFTPASLLSREPEILRGDGAGVLNTLDVAEAVFSAINRMLK